MYVLGFQTADACSLERVGGKAANLGVLTRGGFRVPAGFTVTTMAYRAAAASGPAAGMPDAVRDPIAEAYHRLGNGAAIPVAVRSSATAEDLEGASFAGQHDTYLHVIGLEAVLDAVTRCWASLRSERATAYRAERGIDEAEVAMGVVVQTMVDAEVSGVMFSANPLNEACDEVVINASWGLGEAVVQGMVNPDQLTVRKADLQVIEARIAEKTQEVVPLPDGRGVGVVEVDATRRVAPALADDQIHALADLARRIEGHYGGLPQDIEWAIAGGELYVLQARPITGVTFAWDHEVDFFSVEEEPADAIWSRVLADDVWTGAVTPLMYSHRGRSWVEDYRDAANPILRDDTLAALRVMKYHKGEVYVNTEVEQRFMRAAHPAARPGMAVRLPPELQDASVRQPFSYLDFVKALARAKLVYPHVGGPKGWMRYIDNCFENRIEEANGLSDDELRALDDAALKRYISRICATEMAYNRALIWPGMFLYVPHLMTALMTMLMRWYDGEHDPAAAFTTLITGTQNVTHTVREHLALHEMSRMIAASARLVSDFRTHPGEAFFGVLAESEDGRALAAKVESFLAESGHRGHADRDIYFPRFRDDLSILYRALEAHGKSDVDPIIREQQNNARREALIEEIAANIRRGTFGALKLEAFKYALDYVLRFLEYRDDERHFVDRITYSIRRGYLEVNRRIRERGRLDSDRDFWFLSAPELYAVLDGRYDASLTAAKIRGRMHNFDRFNARVVTPPKFLRGNHPYLPDAPVGPAATSGVLGGMPTSAGTICGVARVVKELGQIGRLGAGEILVTNSTDPGWSPVFAVISGIVVETGGMLSHSSCLAREYGFPAVQVEDAMRLIPDGATITVDGNTGQVTIQNAADPTIVDQQPAPV